MRMGARRNLSESEGSQKPAAQSKFRCVIIKIGAGDGFGTVALRITQCFQWEILSPPVGGGALDHTFQRVVFPIRTLPLHLERPLVRSSEPPPRPRVMLGLRPIRTATPQPRNFVTSFIDPLIAFVSANAWLAYLTLFLAALLEAVPVIGSVIPGSTIILAVTALIPGGELKLEWVLAAAVAGATLGAGSAFWIGHPPPPKLLPTSPLSTYPPLHAQSEAFFHRWGVLAVFFARFVPPLRAFVPITAGDLATPPPPFYPVNPAAIRFCPPTPSP